MYLYYPYQAPLPLQEAPTHVFFNNYSKYNKQAPTFCPENKHVVLLIYCTFADKVAISV